MEENPAEDTVERLFNGKKRMLREHFESYPPVNSSLQEQTPIERLQANKERLVARGKTNTRRINEN